jgi:hypothetical protein
MRTRIGVALFVSGNLAAETVLLVHDFLVSRVEFVPTLITDGYHPTSVVRDDVLRWPSDAAKSAIAAADLLLTSIRSPGTVERAVLTYAKQVKTRQVVLLADLGTGPAKFCEDGGWVLPDVLAVADTTTEQIFLRAGIPEARLRRVGSPYLDSFLNVEVLESSPAHDLAFFSVPNALDFRIWGVEAPYQEADVLDVLREFVMISGHRACVRAHPKELTYLDDTQRWRGFAPESCLEVSTTEYVINHRAVISTYSTALLVARVLRRFSASLQPKIQQPVRSDLYEAWNIPIVQTAGGLLKLFEAGAPIPARHSVPLYNPGRALDAVANLLLEMS